MLLVHLVYGDCIFIFTMLEIVVKNNFVKYILDSVFSFVFQVFFFEDAPTNLKQLKRHCKNVSLEIHSICFVLVKQGR